MDLLHSRPYTGTREGSDLVKNQQSASFQVKMPAETICITVQVSKIQLLRSFFSQNFNFFKFLTQNVKTEVYKSSIRVIAG